MDQLKLHHLIIDKDLSKLFVPVSKKEYARLERLALHNEVQIPVITWNRIVISGFVMYKIYHKNNIPFHMIEKNFFSKNEVITYICVNSLKASNINKAQTKYCIGHLYAAQRELLKENYPFHYPEPTEEIKALPHFNLFRWHTISLLEDKHLSMSSIYRYNTYACAIDEIYDKNPDIAKAILSGNVYISSPNTLTLSKLAKSDMRREWQNMLQYSRKIILHNETNGGATDVNDTPPKNERKPIEAAIKQMPLYDPDAEFSSLTFTIPMWINSITRILSNANFKAASAGALQKLEQQLNHLGESIQNMTIKIQEEHHE